MGSIEHWYSITLGPGALVSFSPLLYETRANEAEPARMVLKKYKIWGAYGCQ